MNEETLVDLVADVRRCPFECGWEAQRSMKASYLQSPLGKLPAFIERCQHDLVPHLIEAHGATRHAETVEANGGAA